TAQAPVSLRSLLLRGSAKGALRETSSSPPQRARRLTTWGPRTVRPRRRHPSRPAVTELDVEAKGTIHGGSLPCRPVPGRAGQVVGVGDSRLAPRFLQHHRLGIPLTPLVSGLFLKRDRLPLRVLPQGVDQGLRVRDDNLLRLGGGTRDEPRQRR